MRRRFIRPLGTAMAAAAVLWSAARAIDAQENKGAVAIAAAVEASKKWNPPRTSDGQPDIQGMYIADDWGKPLETPAPRPQASPGGQAAPRASASGPPAEDIWVDTKTTSDRSAMIVDPPDGKTPWLPWAVKTKSYISTVQGTQGKVDPLFLDPATKCLPYGVPRSNSPNPYSGYQILQRPGYVVIYYEQGHQFRMIPLDNRPHPSSKIRLWMGSSRGRWDGNI